MDKDQSQAAGILSADRRVDAAQHERWRQEQEHQQVLTVDQETRTARYSSFELRVVTITDVRPADISDRSSVPCLSSPEVSSVRRTASRRLYYPHVGMIYTTTRCYWQRYNIRSQ